jgi:hypothetical protein
LTAVERVEVEEKWVAFAEGRLAKADVHTWADRCLREVEETAPLVVHGLQDLHGLTGRNSGGATDAAARGLAKWREECAAYDRDPEGWTRQRVERAMNGLRAEGRITDDRSG